MLTEIVTSHGNANDLFALGVNSRVSPTDRSSAATQRSRHRDRRCTDCRHACERRRRLGDRHCNARRRRLSLPVTDRNVTTICPVYGQSPKMHWLAKCHCTTDQVTPPGQSTDPNKAMDFNLSRQASGRREYRAATTHRLQSPICQQCTRKAHWSWPQKLRCMKSTFRS